MRPDNITMHNAGRAPRTLSPYIRTKATTQGYRRRPSTLWRGIKWLFAIVAVFALVGAAVGRV